jgi:DNA-binding IclR family transcriptional regulator
MTRMAGFAVLVSQTIAERLRLNPTDLETLEILLREGALPAGKLAERTGLTTGAVTGITDRLERRGYVRRQPDPADRRRVIVAVELEAVNREVMPLYAGIQAATAALVATRSDRDLTLLLGFIEEANAVAAAQIERLRSHPAPAPPAATDHTVPSRSSER